MAEVNWTSQALEDVNGIASFIARESEHFAKAQTHLFFERVKLLENFPLSGRIVPEFNKTNIREVILGNYRIVYKIISAFYIDIITVHHSARRLKKSVLYGK